MMTRGTKEFIREHLDLIDTNEWDKFYDIVSLNENFQLLYQIGEVTTFLYDCGCNPLAYLTNIPTGFLAGSSIEEIVIPEGIKSIRMGELRGAQNLREVTLPKSCNQIGTNAFFYCSSLEEVTINTTNQYFGDEVFSACAKLYNINYEGTKLQRLEHLVPDSDFVIQCTDGRIVVDEKGKVQLNV